MMEPTFALAAFMPFLFAIIATAAAWRYIRNPFLFFVFTLFLFVGLQDFAYAPISDLVVHYPPKDAFRLLSEETRARFMADMVCAALGGILAWRLGIALGRKSAA